MPGNDQSEVGHEGPRPEGNRLEEDNPYRIWVKLFDPLHFFVDAARDSRRCWVADILPREYHIIRRKRLTVVPGDIALELPGHGQPVARHASVLHAWYLGREDRYQIGFGVPCRERLVENARRIDVLLADAE